MNDSMIEATPETEARRVLVDHAYRRFGKLNVAAVVDLALRSGDGDFPVQLAALDALARRFAAVMRDGLRVSARPKGGLGDWSVGRRGGATYRVRVSSIDPIEVSCSCADYVRSSLGLCKHGMLALSRAPKRAKAATPIASARSRLKWTPFDQASAPTDRLARIDVEGGRRLPGLAAGAPLGSTLTRLGPRQELLTALERRVGAGSLDAEPGAARVIEEELRRARALNSALKALPAARAALRSMRRRLYPYQREAVLRFLKAGALLLADDMGLGKTIQAIACCHALLASGTVKRALLIVPTSLRPQWAREWRATTTEPLTMVEGSPEQRAALYASTKRGALIVGYEQFLRDIAQVRQWAPEVVVLDEAQRIKNWATKSAATVKSLSPAYRLALTGTPLENRLDELASIVDFIDDVALEPKWRLTPYHTFQEGDGDEGVSGARNLGALRARLAPLMLRRHRADVVSQLPERMDTRVPVELTPSQAIEHDELYPQIAALVRLARKRGLRQPEFLRLMRLLTQQRIIANGLAQHRFDELWKELEPKAPTEARLRSLFTPKLAALQTIIEDLAITQRRKVVVFSQWRAMVRLGEWALRDRLAAEGMRAAFFTGAERSRQREQALVDFHDDPNVSVLFLTDAGGTGLNLQRAASACVLMELPWNPAVLEQRIARIHRIGQTQPIDVFHLVTEDSIESRIADVVGRKKALFDALFDGTSNEVRYDSSASFMAQMRAVYEDVDAQAESSVQGSQDEGGHEEALDDETLGAEVLDNDTLEDERLGDSTSAELGFGSSGPIAAQADARLGASLPSHGALHVRRRPDGGLTIDVPPELAPALASVFASLADALRGGHG